MFTGIVEDVGKVKEISLRSGGGVIKVETKLGDIKVGDSVSVNGVCLTAVEVSGRTVTFEMSPETLSRSNLRFLRVGSPVNLERSLRPDSRMGGHLVMGHVDFTARIISFRPEGEHRDLVIEVPRDREVFFAEKGSVAVDGISLTVNRVKEGSISITIIPFTFENTNLRFRRVGDLVNVEIDPIARYVVRFMSIMERKDLGDLLEDL